MQNHPLLSKDKENLVYWAVAFVYALFVAAGSGGLWWVLSLVLVALAARQGFPELVKMFLLTKESEAITRFSTDKEAKRLVLTLAIAAALYTMAIPLTSPFAAFLGALVAWFGSKRVIDSSEQY